MVHKEQGGWQSKWGWQATTHAVFICQQDLQARHNLDPSARVQLLARVTWMQP